MLIPSTELLQMGSWFSLVGTHFIRPRNEAPSSCRRIILNFVHLISRLRGCKSYVIPPASVEAACACLVPSWECGHCSGGSQGLARPAESPGLGTSLPVTASPHLRKQTREAWHFLYKWDNKNDAKVYADAPGSVNCGQHMARCPGRRYRATATLLLFI